MTNDIETLSNKQRREWFRRKVADIGTLFRQLPVSRRDMFLDTIEGDTESQTVKNINESNACDPALTKHGKHVSESLSLKGNGSISESLCTAQRASLPTPSATDRKMKG
jgi:hypothetical protein